MTGQKLALAYGGPPHQSRRDPTTLPEALYRAAHQVVEKGLTYLQTDGSEIIQSYAGLYEEAERILVGLHALGLRPGDKVILQIEANQEYVPTFWACVLGGLIAVPISIAPSYAQPSVTTAKLQKAWELCERPLVVASSTLASALRMLAPTLGMEPLWLETVDSLRSTYPRIQEERPWHTSQPGDTFMILFTSGSTGIPKGVILNHRNILSLASGFAHLEGLSNQEITFNWMPLDHVGGLITFHLRDVYLGCQQIHASPQTVLQEPLSWLDCLDRYHATCTWAPNFAFSLINDQASTIAQRQWDLSALHYVLNAGEAIVPKTARRFLELLGPHGLPDTAIHPSWGMSETSSGVTFSSRFSLETTTDEDRFVDVGALIPDVWVRVVDIQDRLLPEGQSGRIQVKGPTVTQGYYRNPGLNQEVFTADGWFDTGDIGMLQDGRLTITGRSKNIIIINGLNYYCHEIEAVVEECPDVEVTYTGACAVRNATSNTDALAIFYCTKPLDETEVLELCKEIRRRVVREVGINPTYLLPLEKEAIPKTESGKIQRTRLKQQFEDGMFDSLRARIDLLLGNVASDGSVGEDAGQTEIEQQLRQIWQSVLRSTTIRSSDNFFELGGDSLVLMRLLARLRETFHVILPPRSVFDFPTLATLARHIELQQNAIIQEKAALTIEPGARTGPLPLSFTQQRLWFLDRLNPGSAAYVVSGVFHLQGQLQISVLKKSLQEIVRRHETLRTNFHMHEGQPVLSIAPDLEIGLARIHLEHLLPQEQELAVQHFITMEVQQPFDLTQGPLARFTLLSLEAETYVFMVSIHHIISDGWSMDIFYHELAALYAAFGRGEPSPLPELPVQFIDFASWQRRWLQGEVLEQELAYWKQYLNGAPPLLTLPTDRPRPAVQTDHGAHYSFLLPLILQQQLKALSQQENTTLFMTLLAAFNVLLYRYSGQEDLIVGTLIANRSSKAVESLIGYFANTLALRTDLSGSLSFRMLLARVREVTLEAYTHQDIPFEQLVDTLQLERNMGYSPLVQAVFVLQNQQMFSLDLNGLTVTALPFESGKAKLDLILSLVETDAGLRGLLEYNTDLFDTDTIVRMMAHWQTILESVVANPDWQIANVPLMSTAEYTHLLTEWNATKVDYAATPLQQLFEMQVEHVPERIALSCEDEALTYAELNRRANQLAHYLQGLGVGPDVLVGICMERSLDLVIALLGILKSGGAYVPLDPTYPQERLLYMLEDSQVRVLLTQREWLPQISAYQATILCLDEARVLLARERACSPSSQMNAEQLAYMIYTSGSTGKPKGAINTYKGLHNRLLWMQDAYALTAADVVLQKTSFSFDVSVWEFFWPLIAGARLALARPGGHQDNAYLVRLIQEQQISTLHFVPPMLNLFLQEREVEQCDSLRQVICSGEALPLDLQKRFFSSLQASLHNLYGPTEAAIDVTSWECERVSQLAGVPIGYPIANTQIYLLDSQMQPVPLGVPGEIYIGGISLARGYWQRSGLTAEKFLPDPFSREPGSRLYRTGDLARYLPNGVIEYLERLDNQVKVRGFRIELGEIEAALLQHPAVRECAVLVREETPGDRRLVAYIVLQEASTPLGRDLRAFLQEPLPNYMLPAAFVSLESLPLTPNGKVDRRALLALEAPHLAHGMIYVPPCTPLEQVLAGIWIEILRAPQVGMNDNFFALGGHSLLAIQLVFRVSKDFQMELPLQSLFEHPTLAEFAEALPSYEVVPGMVARIAQLRQRLQEMSQDEQRTLLESKRNEK